MRIVNRSRCRSGFTLIELLVVIAIIAILASLLTPAVKGALDKAKLTSCAMNMKQIGTLCMSYAFDHEGRYPFSNSSLQDGWDTSISWDDRLSGYDGRNVTQDQKDNQWLKASWFGPDGGLYQCPDDNLKRLYGTDPDTIPMTYAMSLSIRFIGGGFQPKARGISGKMDGKPDSLLLSEVTVPGSTVGLAEQINEGRMMGRYSRCNIQVQDLFDALEDIPHDGVDQANYMMADGHVERLNFYETLLLPDGSSASPTDVTGSLWDAHK